MAHKEHDTGDKKILLPITVTGPVDVGRLIRELGDIEDALHQLGLRSGGDKVKMPKTSRLMDQIVEANKLNLLHETDRSYLKQFLDITKQKAPILHISFSADPSAAFTQQLMTWLRREIDPNVLLTIGLQPNIGAGCILRTTNKYFDLSLKEDFAKKRSLLLQSLDTKQKAAV